MPRLRTIKPSFFINEDLAQIEPVGRILFAALWCLADRRGRLEDRPRRIKAEALPYDDCDVDGLLAQLTDGGFIHRYTVNERRYIQILRFERHQVPHIKEAESTIPAPDEHGAFPVLAPPVNLNGLLSSVNGESVVDMAADAAVPAPEPEPTVDYSRELFEEYRVRIQPKAKLIDDARRKIQTRLRRWSSEELRAAIEHFAADAWQMEHNAHRGAAWFFASDSRIEQYANLAPRKAGANGTAHAPSTAANRFQNTSTPFPEVAL